MNLGRARVVFGIAAVVILPSLGLLYYLDQRSLLGADRQTASHRPSQRNRVAQIDESRSDTERLIS